MGGSLNPSVQTTSIRGLTFVDMLDLEAQNKREPDSGGRKESWDRREIMRNFACSHEDAQLPFSTSVSRTSTLSGRCYQCEQAHSDHDGPQKCTYSGRPRRPSASGRAVDCTMALHNASSCCSCHCCGAHDHASCHLRPNRLAFVPVLDDLVHRLKSLGNEMDPRAGVVQDRAVDADAAGFHCHTLWP